MIEPLPVRRTHTFQQDLQQLIPKKNRDNLILDLEHITKDDLRRFEIKVSLIRFVFIFLT